jgi:hypothetical protein
MPYAGFGAMLGNAVAPGLGAVVGAIGGVIAADPQGAADTARGLASTPAERCAQRYGGEWTYDPDRGCCVLPTAYAHALIAAAREGRTDARETIARVLQGYASGEPSASAAYGILDDAHDDQTVSEIVASWLGADTSGRPVSISQAAASTGSACCASCAQRAQHPDPRAR